MHKSKKLRLISQTPSSPFQDGGTYIDPDKSQ